GFVAVGPYLPAASGSTKSSQFYVTKYASNLSLKASNYAGQSVIDPTTSGNFVLDIVELTSVAFSKSATDGIVIQAQIHTELKPGSTVSFTVTDGLDPLYKITSPCVVVTDGSGNGTCSVSSRILSDISGGPPLILTFTVVHPDGTTYVTD